MSATIIDGKAFAAGLRAGIGRRGRGPGGGGRHAGARGGARRRGPGEPGLRAQQGAPDRSRPACAPSTMRCRPRPREAELLALVARLNADPEVDGILVQLPLPPQIDAAAGDRGDRSGQGRRRLPPDQCRAAPRPARRRFVPCTPLGSLLLIKSVRAATSPGSTPWWSAARTSSASRWRSSCSPQNCTVTMAHSRTRDLPGLCRRADILVAAVGRPEMVRGDWVKPGAVVIDVGINRVPDRRPGRGGPGSSATSPSRRPPRSRARSRRCRAASGR